MPLATVGRSIDEQVVHMFALVSDGIAAATAAFIGGDLEDHIALRIQDDG